jgi:hypothetical protein
MHEADPVRDAELCSPGPCPSTKIVLMSTPVPLTP